MFCDRLEGEEGKENRATTVGALLHRTHQFPRYKYSYGVTTCKQQPNNVRGKLSLRRGQDMESGAGGGRYHWATGISVTHALLRMN